MEYQKDLAWISFFGPRRPINGQKIYYFGPDIGVWQGRYEIRRDDPVSPHIIVCEQRDEETQQLLSEYGLGGLEQIVDRMDAPWWMPYEGQRKPVKPEKDYPPDYPK